MSNLLKFVGINASEQSQCQQRLRNKINSYAGLSFIDLVSVGLSERKAETL
jgi:hypothetical protein